MSVSAQTMGQRTEVGKNIRAARWPRQPRVHILSGLVKTGVSVHATLVIDEGSIRRRNEVGADSGRVQLTSPHSELLKSSASQNLSLWVVKPNLNLEQHYCGNRPTDHRRAPQVTKNTSRRSFFTFQVWLFCCRSPW